jgi:aryl-alcohol dehydrogenase-like predicted oxidoreductase
MNESIMARSVGEWSVPALGVGTWALGGDWYFNGEPAGWGPVDDDESVAAIRAAHDGGVRFVDTADV